MKNLRNDRQDAGRNRLHAILSEPDVVGALGRHVEVIVLDISRSGCLLESGTEIPVGTLAVVRVKVDGTEYSDAVRVTRTQLMPGSGERYRIGTEFAWLWAPSPHSVRRLASWISSGAAHPASPRGPE